MSDSSTDRLNRLWYADLPRKVDPFSPPVADALADGGWMAGLRRTAALLPPIAFGVGFLFPLIWPGLRNVFSESFTFLALVIGGALINGAAGLMLLLGYACGDMLHDLFFGMARSGYLGRQLSANVVSYMLMGVVAVIIPQAARRLAAGITGKMDDSALSRVGQVILSAVSVALLVFLWCQATIVLIRPVFTWVYDSPTVEAVKHVQRAWGVLVGIAVGAVILRALGELAAARMAGWARVQDLRQLRWSTPERRGALWARVPVVLRVLVAAAGVTLLLAGTYVTKADAAIVFFAVAVLKAWRSGMFGRMPRAWVSTISRVPALVRFALAPLLGYVLSYPVISFFWSRGSLRPVMIGALLTVIILHLLFPPSPVGLHTPREAT